MPYPHGSGVKYHPSKETITPKPVTIQLIVINNNLLHIGFIFKVPRLEKVMQQIGWIVLEWFITSKIQTEIVVHLKNHPPG